MTEEVPGVTTSTERRAAPAHASLAFHGGEHTSARTYTYTHTGKHTYTRAVAHTGARWDTHTRAEARAL